MECIFIDIGAKSDSCGRDENIETEGQLLASCGGQLVSHVGTLSVIRVHVVGEVVVWGYKVVGVVVHGGGGV